MDDGCAVLDSARENDVAVFKGVVNGGVVVSAAADVVTSRLIQTYIKLFT